MKKPKPLTRQPTPSTYTVKLSRLAQKQLDKLPDASAERIAARLFELAADPRPSGVKKLKGQEGYRIRMGDYRVQYAIFDAVLLVEIVKVGQRSNFYSE